MFEIIDLTSVTWHRIASHICHVVTSRAWVHRFVPLWQQRGRDELTTEDTENTEMDEEEKGF